MSEDTEEVIINEQSIETGNIVYIKRREAKKIRKKSKNKQTNKKQQHNVYWTPL